MRKTIILLAVLLLTSVLVFSQQKKENDVDIIYDESKVPNYHLPELFVSAEGDTISNVNDWMNIRRPQILSLFGNLVYGRIPAPETPVITEFIEQYVNENFKEGKGTRKEILIRFSNEKGKAEMTILALSQCVEIRKYGR